MQSLWKNRLAKPMFLKMRIAFADVTFEKGSKDTAVAFPKDAPVLTEKVNASIKQINDQN